MPAGFAGLQPLEARLVTAALEGVQARWLLEIAPTASASPEVDLERCRILIDGERCRFPFHAAIDQLPLEDRSVPAVLLRHVWQPSIVLDPLDEALRVLKPGGVLISVSANPWHRQAWRELGTRAMRLPSWPQFQLIHARRNLSLAVPAVNQLRGFVPGLTAALVLVARKPAEPGYIEPIRFSEPRMAPGSVAVSHCRAA